MFEGAASRQGRGGEGKVRGWEGNEGREEKGREGEGWEGSEMDPRNFE